VSATVSLDRGWGLMLRDLEIDPRDVARRAGLPADLLARESSRVAVPDFFRLIEAIEAEANDPELPIRAGQSASPEGFSPAIFAALCSSTLAVAVQRIATHKPLIAPMSVAHRITEEGLAVEWAWDDPTLRPPRLLVAFELVMMTQLMRIGTRERVRPVRVTCPVPLEPAGAYEAYFGVAPEPGRLPGLVFAHDDACRPFLTASEALWRSFEPELRRQLAELDARASVTARTRSLLLESLPGGEAEVQCIARRLGMSTRTLQRRLGDEGATFRQVVQATREQLARHYLGNTALPFAEISFLLGFDEESSFFRAFKAWTGTTPSALRQAGS
jgi:AraC-like DNA-binding protein